MTRADEPSMKTNVLKLIPVAVADLIPYVRNSRTHSEAQPCERNLCKELLHCDDLPIVCQGDSATGNGQTPPQNQLEQRRAENPQRLL